ncbi:magnesium and cobalt transport protein CorA [Rothia sp. AR01]|uniref:Magnesium and cobalt transport protein CorA n=1 Tax=Rothia santali TaxID=2949643 RepID=A0A9X2HEJ1_9MICC|nr:magnesium and cobalt transport protein CorA [Rothia santali]MCP3426635.1 magnesium and cobalt transport protein CorA [Rothia santali]
MPFLLTAASDADGRYRTVDSASAALDVLDSGRDATVCLVAQDPTDEEVRACAERFELHALALEDTAHWRQRPKLERYGDTLFVVLRPARYDEDAERMEFGEIHAFVGPDFFIVFTEHPAGSERVAHWMRRAFKRHHLDPQNPQTLLYFLLDGVVDEYEPILESLDEDLDEVEEQLFTGQNASQRIYEMFNEVVKFQRAARPLGYMLELLMRGSEKYGVSEELHRHFRDVRDHVTRDVERLDGLRSALQNALTIESTLVGQRQNDAMKKLSGWAAVLIAPTIIAGIYGMNFDDMPELGWRYGYPFALGLMVTTSFGLWVVFKVKKWL